MGEIVPPLRPEPFRVVLADPPWQYGDQLRMSAVKRSSGDQYATMRVEDIKMLRAGVGCQIADHVIADEALLFLWVTNPFLLDNSGPSVCRYWGFEPKQIVTWVKSKTDWRADHWRLQIGMGHISRGCTEQLIIATRGKYSHLIKRHDVPNVLVAPRGRHSAKPEAAYDLIESLVDGPYLELFARNRRPGWTSWGWEVPAEPSTPTHDEEIAWP